MELACFLLSVSLSLCCPRSVLGLPFASLRDVREELQTFHNLSTGAQGVPVGYSRGGPTSPRLPSRGFPVALCDVWTCPRDCWA